MPIIMKFIVDFGIVLGIATALIWRFRSFTQAAAGLLSDLRDFIRQLRMLRRELSKLKSPAQRHPLK
jgi:hypothetical protein